jgi:hypothetical protein
MIYEKRWKAVSPRTFTSSGTSLGVVSISSTKGFYVKQKVLVQQAGVSTAFQVQEVLSKTQLVLGPVGSDLKQVSDLSAYTTAATIRADKQTRPAIEAKEYERAVFEEEPVVAKRVVLVDEVGDKYAKDNPLPVQLSDGSINIGTVNAELEVQLSHKDDTPNPGDVADSVRIGDGTYELDVNPDGSINVNVQNSSGGNDVISEFAEITSVPLSTMTDILTYTVPAGFTLKLAKIEVSGSNIATYEVTVDGTLEARKRTWFSGPISETFNFETAAAGGFPVLAGSVIKVRVIHGRPMLGDFEARLIGELDQ